MGKWDSMSARRVLRGWEGCVCSFNGSLDTIVGEMLVMWSVGYCSPSTVTRDWRCVDILAIRRCAGTTLPITLRDSKRGKRIVPTTFSDQKAAPKNP